MSLAQGQVTTISVSHIISELTIANQLAINLRQPAGSALSFVAFTENEGKTQIEVDALQLLSGEEFTLTIESFDSNSNV